MARQVKRCDWAESSSLDIEYHDKEWGVPVHDDRLLFEMLILEGAQAGLSWSTILKKRQGYLDAFDNFDAAKIARYTDKKLEKLLLNPAIIRNRLKVFATRTNAKNFLDVQKEFGSFDAYIWSFVDNRPINNRWKTMSEMPSSSIESDAMCKALKKRGFKFVGTTICYAYMQGVGVVNDHLTSCFCYTKVKKLQTRAR